MPGLSGVGGLRVAPFGGAYSDRIMSKSPIAYWPLWESGGVVARCLVNPLQNGAYTGVTLGQPGIGDGGTTPFFDGANDYINIHTPTLVSRFDGAEGSVLVWLRMANVGVWADGNWRYIFDLRVNANNGVLSYKDGAAPNQIVVTYNANGVGESWVGVIAPTANWYSLGVTWSASADAVLFFWNGNRVQTSVALGVFAGALTTALIGSRPVAPTLVMHGYEGHFALWDRALSLTDMAEVGIL